SSFQPVPAASTPTGSPVTVQPTGVPVSVTFPSVTTAGLTTVITSNTGPPVPTGFQLASVYYDISTTATFTPPALVCIYFPGLSASDKLYHFEGGVAVDRTVSVDTTTNIICASVSSFSPFAILR